MLVDGRAAVIKDDVPYTAQSWTGKYHHEVQDESAYDPRRP